jgi:hypothetical protein
MRTLAILAAVMAPLLLSSCGGTDRRHSLHPAATRSAPSFIELRTKISTGTLHFSPGLYTLDSEDPKGYYYRAPRKVYQRSFSGRLPRDGGIFVLKRNQRKLRGYVVMPSGLTHVGNLSGADYEFRY